MITIDCLRASTVGAFGGKKLTPNIDKLANKSIKFTRAFANGPGTTQSFPAILTSRYFLMQKGLRPQDNCITLAEVLSNNGYKTVAFHSNPFLSTFFGWDRGFKEFYDFIRETKSPSAAISQDGIFKWFLKKLAKKFKLGYNKKFQKLLKIIYFWFSSYQVPYLEAIELNDHVFRWITKNKDDKFFLWMHYMDPHPPFIPPEHYLTNFNTRIEAFKFNMQVNIEKLSQGQLHLLKDLYESEVRYVDDSIGNLIKFLNKENILNKSLIIFLSDHGYAFMEHNKFGHNPEILYNEVLHVPLFIYGLGIYKEINVPVQLLDVSPTILNINGIRKPKKFIGDSLLSSIKNYEISKTIFSESAKPDLINLKFDTSKKIISCIKGNWKLINNELWGTQELYNLEKDFHEKINLVETEKQIFNELNQDIYNHLFFREEILKC